MYPADIFYFVSYFSIPYTRVVATKT